MDPYLLNASVGLLSGFALLPALLICIAAGFISHWLALKYLPFSYRVTKNREAAIAATALVFLVLFFSFFWALMLLLAGILGEEGQIALAYLFFSGGLTLFIDFLIVAIGVFLFLKEFPKAKAKVGNAPKAKWKDQALFAISILLFLLLGLVAGVFAFL